MDIIALDRNKDAPPDFEASVATMADWCRNEIKRRAKCGEMGGRPKISKRVIRAIKESVDTDVNWGA